MEASKSRVVTEFPGKREVFSREEWGEEERLSQSKGSLSWMYRALQKSLLLEMIVFFYRIAIHVCTVHCCTDDGQSDNLMIFVLSFGFLYLSTIFPNPGNREI